MSSITLACRKRSCACSILGRFCLCWWRTRGRASTWKLARRRLPQALKMPLIKNRQTLLQDIGFMNEKQTEHMMQGIHRIFSRGVQTRDDAAILLGVARQALWAHHNPALEGRKPSIG